MELYFEPGREADLDELGRLYDRLNEHLEQTVNYPGWRKGIYPVRETAAEGVAAHSLFVAKSEGRIAGALILWRRQDPAYRKAAWVVNAREEEVLTVHTLAVHPAFGGRGVGEALIRFAIRYACRAGAKALRLDVCEGNRPAIRLYERCGFTQVGTVDLGLHDWGLDWFRLYEKAVPPPGKCPWGCSWEPERDDGERLFLAPPAPLWREAVLAYQEEHLAAGEKKLSGASLLGELGFDEWMTSARAGSGPACPQGGRLVPLLALRKSDGALVGMAEFCLRSGGSLAAGGGQISCGVRPSQRGRGYGSALLRLAIEKAASQGLPGAKVVCGRDDEPARRMILRCGGVLEREFVHTDGRTMQVYGLGLTGADGGPGARARG